MSLYKAIPSWFSLDTRSLAIARRIFGFTIFLIQWLSFGWRNGTSPTSALFLREVFVLSFQNSLTWSFYSLGGSLGFVWFGMAFQAFCGLALVLGCLTRIATVFVLLFAISLELRNPILTSEADRVIRSLFVIWLEGVAPWFLIDGWLAPARWRWALTVPLISVFPAFHLGTFVLMKLGNLPALCSAIWVALIAQEVCSLAIKLKPNIFTLVERAYSPFILPVVGNSGTAPRRPFVLVFSQGFCVAMFVNFVFVNPNSSKPSS